MLKTMIYQKMVCINEGEIATRLGLSSVPSIAEKIIIERDLSLLDEFKCRYPYKPNFLKNRLMSLKKINQMEKNLQLVSLLIIFLCKR